MITPVLIAKYFEGHCTPDEEKMIAEWRLQSPQNEKVFNSLKIIWEETGKVRPISEEQETQAAWQKLQQKLHSTPAQQTKLIPKRKTLAYILPRAAAAILVFTSMVIFYLVKNNNSTQVVEMIEISTQTGEKKQLQLADGSTVWLNAESTIKYPKKFEGKTREVYLEGEAYFEVKTNPAQPFKVHTNELTTKVLGTKFNVLAYPELDDITVALDEGKVELSYENTIMDLEPGKKVQYSKQTHQFNKINITTKHNLWRNNVIDFDNVTLAQATTTIQRWFGKKVVIENKKLEGCLVTASFKNPEMESVMEIITTILSLQSQEIDGVYYIKGDNCL